MAGARITSLVFHSTIWRRTWFITEIERIKPNLIVMTEEFDRRSIITVERLAQNLIDATPYDMKDNVGRCPQDQSVVEGGPATYYSTLPLRVMVKAMRNSGVPADISDTAGSFGCILLMYAVLHYTAHENLHIRAHWIHLPALPITVALEKKYSYASYVRRNGH